MSEAPDRPGEAADSAKQAGERDPIDATAMLDLVLGPVANVADVLHHAARQRTVPRRIALPGSYLAFDDEKGEQLLLPLDAPQTRIGRSSAAEIQLEDIRVSRKHAIISREVDAIRILDDGSSTGTHVNGVAVVATELNDGDVIRLGSVTFTFVVVR